MSEIVVVGSLNMDLTVSTDKLPRMGETVIGTGFATIPGGKGANQAVAAARLGAKVGMIGCVGTDTFGDTLVGVLNAEGVDTGRVYRLEDTTGIAIITVYRGDNCIILDSGANYRLTPQHILQSEAAIAGARVLVLQLEIPLETVRCALEIARRHGVTTLLNPAPALPLDNKLLGLVDVLLPNESEAELLTGLRLTNETDILAALQRFTALGVGRTVITLGSQGSAFEQDGHLVVLPAHQVAVADTTAAGDSFVAALAVQLAAGSSISQSLRFCNAVGALTVTRKGAQPSLPTRDEVEAYLGGHTPGQTIQA